MFPGERKTDAAGITAPVFRLILLWSALFQEGLGEDVPLPGQGAGLGLSVARDIAALHRGSMLTEWVHTVPMAPASWPAAVRPLKRFP